MEYKKDFNKWFSIKENIENNSHPSFKEREVWWCYFGCNVGTEKDGKSPLYLRPVIVFHKINSKSLIAIPLTRTMSDNDLHIPFYFNYDFSVADIAHIRSLDSKRLYEKIADISDYIHNKIKNAITKRFLR